MNKPELSCGHTDVSDLTAGGATFGPNIICHICGAHWWKGREYTAREWADYVEDVECSEVEARVKEPGDG